MPFKVTILGCNSAIPTTKRKPTAQLLNVAERFFLIDCGEGTQLQLRKYKVKMQRITHVFISHLHGDHYFGLIGLISTMHLLGREKELHIHGHPKLKEIINVQLEASNTILRYPLFFHPFSFEQSEVILEEAQLTVETIPLNHSVPCCGFLFKEKQLDRRMKREKIEEHDIPLSVIPDIKGGADYTLPNGEIVSHWELTNPAVKARSFAFCSDTAYYEEIVPQIKGVDLLYHEATFLDELKDRAQHTKHSTALEAATIAQKAAVKKLIIGHYSSRYSDLQPLLDEAQSVFAATTLGIEGETYEIERTYDIVSR